MATFESVHGEAITGKLVMFDRLLFKGYLGFMGGGEALPVTAEPRNSHLHLPPADRL